ncbi:hypothetical protein H17ap60334_04867 [Thermosipho africanus H17ap60334]|nr:hypothetical protein H17ap60334_04867 [Thermosipho africanus H17ap60334]
MGNKDSKNLKTEIKEDKIRIKAKVFRKLMLLALFYVADGKLDGRTKLQKNSFLFLKRSSQKRKVK